MMARVQQLNLAINALSLRERAIVAAVAVVVLVTLWFVLLFDPAQQGYASASKQRTQLATKSQALDTQLTLLKQRVAQDPNAEERARITGVRGDITEADAQLKEKTLELITPAQMARVVQDLIDKNSALKISALRSEPSRLAQGLFGEPDAEASSSSSSRPSSKKTEKGDEHTPQVYEHALVVELSGSYLDALDYLSALEALPWRLFWDDVQIQTEDYPTAQIRIRIHTLSLHEGWIGV